MRIEFFKQLERGEISFERDIIFDLLFELTLAQQELDIRKKLFT